MTQRKPQFFSIPARTMGSTCRGCFQTVYWIVTYAGHRMPVSTAVDGAKEPTSESPGQGISHFANCVKAAEFRKR